MFSVKGYNFYVFLSTDSRTLIKERFQTTQWTEELKQHKADDVRWILNQISASAITVEAKARPYAIAQNNVIGNNGNKYGMGWDPYLEASKQLL